MSACPQPISRFCAANSRGECPAFPGFAPGECETRGLCEAGAIRLRQTLTKVPYCSAIPFAQRSGSVESAQFECTVQHPKLRSEAH